MAAQRQKLEQAVDAWRRDAEHWRARYESLATPGVPGRPVALGRCWCSRHGVEHSVLSVLSFTTALHLDQS